MSCNNIISHSDYIVTKGGNCNFLKPKDGNSNFHKPIQYISNYTPHEPSLGRYIGITPSVHPSVQIHIQPKTFFFFTLCFGHGYFVY